MSPVIPGLVDIIAGLRHHVHEDGSASLCEHTPQCPDAKEVPSIYKVLLDKAERRDDARRAYRRTEAFQMREFQIEDDSDEARENASWEEVMETN